MSEAGETRQGTIGDASLADRFRRLIEAQGPISLTDYMGEANARYYATRDPLGAKGDFITAPEISQIFGELIGLWLVDVWIRAGKPDPVHYVELGPGRGTLAKDALRVMARYDLAPQVHFVEGSPTLRKAQEKAVPGATFHDDLSEVPEDAPMLLVANEFLDALPVRQLVKTADGWREVMVAAKGDRFVLMAGAEPRDDSVPASRRNLSRGTVLEMSSACAAVMGEIGQRLADQGGTALIVDYGYTEPRAGSSVQAVREHSKVDAMEAPGEADLTAHVDFVLMRHIAASKGARWLGTVDQGRWLRRLGIDARAEALAQAAVAGKEGVLTARDRLVNADQMGELFKVMGLAGPGWPSGEGFA